MSNINAKAGNKQLLRCNKNNLLLAIDCAKEEHVANFFDFSTGCFIYKKALHIKNNSLGFEFLFGKALELLKRKRFRKSSIEVYLEDPASYSQSLIYFFQMKDCLVRYVNAFQASSYRDNKRASNDVLDLDGIIRSALMGQYYECPSPLGIYTLIRECTRERQRLIKARTRHKNNLHTLMDLVFSGFLSNSKSGITSYSKGCVELILHKDFGPRLFSKSTQSRILKIIKKAGLNEPEKLSQKLKKLANQNINWIEVQPEVFISRRERLQEQIKLYKAREVCIQVQEKQIAHFLQFSPLALCLSITGAGLISVATIAAELGDPRLWRSIDQAASYAGVIPRQKQSGGSMKEAITYAVPKAANKYLKNALMTIVDVAQRYQHPATQLTGITHPIKESFQKVDIRGGASYMATAKKVLRTIYAMVQNEMVYLPNIKNTSKEHYRIWIEESTQHLCKKWQAQGIIPNEKNYIGRWIRHKNEIIKILDESVK
jgi:transposase